MVCIFFFFQAEDGIRDIGVTGVQTCALPISGKWRPQRNTFPSARGPRAGFSRSRSRSFSGSAATSGRPPAIGNAVPSPGTGRSCVRTYRVDGTRLIYASLADKNDTFLRCLDIISLRGDDVRCEGEER